MSLFDMLVISETKLDKSFPNSQFEIEGFRMCRKDRNIHGGGLIIYLRSDLVYQRLRKLEQCTSCIECITVRLKLGKSAWSTFIGLYRPPSLLKNIWKTELLNLLEVATENSENVFILGDINCDLQRPDKPPKDGRDLLDIMDLYSFNNLITSATRITTKTETLIDVILTNNKRRILTAGVVEPHISDHSLVYAILRASQPRSRSQKMVFRSLKNFENDKFLADLNSVPFSTVMNIFDDVDDKLFAFDSLYCDVLDEHAPIKQVHVRGDQAPYLTDEWRQAMRKRNHLWKMFTRNRTDDNYGVYKSQRNKCTSLRRKAIVSYFKKKSEEVNQDPRQFWMTYRPFLHSKKSHKSNDIILKENDQMITNKESMADIFNEYFVNIAEQIAIPDPSDYGGGFGEHPSIKAIQENINMGASTFSFATTSPACIKQFLTEIKVKKSAGHDRVTPRLIKESAPAIAAPLCTLVNCSIAQSTYPTNWKKGQVTPLFKKDDDLSKTNYRPVTVLPAVNNIFERVLASQLLTHFQGKLSDYLSAYRKNYSCQTALLRLIEEWRECLDRGELVAVIAMDLSKAFDSLPHSLLIAKLKAYGIDSPSCALLDNYLQGRQQRVKLGDTFSTWRDIDRGVPQGSVLGPLFFNIFLNDLFYFITRVKLNGYADDQQIYSSDKDHTALYARLNYELTAAVTWFKDNGLMANPDKFQAMIIGSTEQDFTFVTDNVVIKKHDNIDLLGINIDNKLKFSKHVSTVCEKINKQLQVIKRFRNLVSGDIKVRIYKAFILPFFQYCSSVWHFCGARNADKLELLNKQVLRLICNDRSKSYITLLKTLNMTTLENRRIQDMLTLLFKCISGRAPLYLSSRFTFRKTQYDLRGLNKLVLPKVRTTTYGLHSYTFAAAKWWNCLPDSLRVEQSVKSFKKIIRKFIFELS